MRTATRTPGADEIRLDYTIEAVPGTPLHGTRGVAFYSQLQYSERQQKHGKNTYPDPAEDEVVQVSVTFTRAAGHALEIIRTTTAGGTITESLKIVTKEPVFLEQPHAKPTGVIHLKSA